MDILDINVTKFSSYIQDNSLGDYASIIGLFITLVGFSITIITIIRTKKASEVAIAAVNSMRDDLKKVDTVTNLSSILTEMEEIKRLHREKNYMQLPDRYSKLRASLISIRSSTSILEDEDLKVLQGAIAQLSASEKTLDKVLDKDDNSKSSIPTSKLNGLISNHIDNLQEVLIRVKSKIGEKP